MKNKGGQCGSIEPHVNKGLTKHQAVNAACGAGSVKAGGKGKQKKGRNK